MKRYRWATRVAITTVVAGLLVAACGDDDDDANDAPPDTAAPAATAGDSADTTTPGESSAPTTGGSDTTEVGEPAELTPVRFVAITSAGQANLPTVLRDQGIAEKYGFDIQVTEIAEATQQWTSLRAGEADVASGSFVDLHRQRAAGLEVHAFRSYIGYDSPLLVPADSDITSFEDLRGRKVGVWSANALDFLVARAAGSKAHGLDLGKDVELVEAAPGLLGQLLASGEIDAALQFSSLSVEPLQDGTFVKLTSIPELMDEAGFDSQAFRLLYMVNDDWLEANPDRIDDLRAAFDEGFEVLLNDDEVWPALAAVVGVEDPEILPAYVETQRASYRVAYSADLIEPTQQLVDALVELVGADIVGVEELDPEAFLFAP